MSNHEGAGIITTSTLATFRTAWPTKKYLHIDLKPKRNDCSSVRNASYTVTSNIFRYYLSHSFREGQRAGHSNSAILIFLMQL